MTSYQGVSYSQKYQYDKSKAMKALGIGKTSFYDKLKKYEIKDINHKEEENEVYKNAWGRE